MSPKGVVKQGRETQLPMTKGAAQLLTSVFFFPFLFFTSLPSDTKEKGNGKRERDNEGDRERKRYWKASEIVRIKETERERVREISGGKKGTKEREDEGHRERKRAGERKSEMLEGQKCQKRERKRDTERETERYWRVGQGVDVFFLSASM